MAGKSNFLRTSPKKSKQVLTKEQVYDKIISSPLAMRAVIVELINRGNARISQPLSSLNDEQVKKLFIHLWAESTKGKPSEVVIQI